MFLFAKSDSKSASKPTPGEKQYSIPLSRRAADSRHLCSAYSNQWFAAVDRCKPSDKVAEFSASGLPGYVESKRESRVHYHVLHMRYLSNGATLSSDVSLSKMQTNT